MRRSLYICLFAMSISATATVAATVETAAEKLRNFLENMPNVGPAFAVTVVTPESMVLTYLSGTTKAKNGFPITAETPFYIASQTKAFIGLLAANLDRQGILKLDSSLTDHWPGLKLPEGIDPARYTLRDLLTHQVPIEADLITEVEAYIDAVDPSEYPKLLAKHAKKREAGFVYSNLGYNIYAAILIKSTGKNWKQHLEERILAPMSLNKTSAHSSEYEADELAWGHIWMGKQHGWHEIPPKSDRIMQSAGGMFSSPLDLGLWLQWHLRKEGPADSGLDHNDFSLAQTAYAPIDPNARNAYELPCTGYALGWNICKYGSHTLYVHGGSYTGTRSIMAFSPDLKVGISVLSNSENMTGWLSSRTVVQFLQFLTDDKDADRWALHRQQQYPKRVEKLLEARQREILEAKEESQWHGWRWEPTADELAEYTGQYQGPNKWQLVQLSVDGDRLRLAMHSLNVDLEPAVAGVFGAHATPLSRPEAIKFSRQKNGMVGEFSWRGESYSRVRK